jgi:hypothetical protein
MMDDRFAAQLRRHLLATADERPASDTLAAIIDGVAATAQHPAPLAWLTWFPRRLGPFPSAAVRFALIVLALIIAIVAAGSFAGSQPRRPVDLGGTVQYRVDGGLSTTTIDAVADSPGVAGTAITSSRVGTHTVRLGCTAQSGAVWVLGGRVEKSTIPGEPAGNWSAVIVKDGTPQQIAVWLSADARDASDCDAWLASFDFAGIGPQNFVPVESGSLVRPA